MVARVTIDGLTFDAAGGSDWIYRRLQGWYSSPPMRVSTEDRPNADGSFGVSQAHRSARPLRFEGALYAESSADAIATMWRAFSSIQADGRPFPLTVEDDSGVLTCIVSLSGVAEVDELNDRAAFVDANFIAFDPVKYGQARNAVTALPSAGGGLEYPLHAPSGVLFYGALGNLGRVTLSNAGTAEVWPRFEVTGELTDGFFIQCLETGHVLRYERVVPAGTSVSLDARTGEVLIDGVSDGSTYLTRDEWFPVPAGGSCTVQFNAIGSSSGAPEMTATVADGYW